MKGRYMTRWRDPAKDPRQEAKSNLITREGFEHLQGLYQHLCSTRRPELSRKVGEAAALGDRSENADYTYNKRELNKTIGRIRYLGKRLDELKIIDQKPDDLERVFFAAYVCLEDDDGEELHIRLVGPDETNPNKHWISIDAPLARAVLGKRLDDDVVVSAPGGDQHYIITEIHYE